MLVVNQDKTVILNLDSLYCVMLDKDETNKIIYGVSKSKSDIMKIGKYRTEERAKEVFQEMIQRYANWENMKVGQPSGICEPVYYMPED